MGGKCDKVALMPGDECIAPTTARIAAAANFAFPASGAHHVILSITRDRFSAWLIAALASSLWRAKNEAL